MACIPVYKGKRFPSTEKLLQYLSTEEGIMAHLADGKDTEFLKAIEGAVSAAEKSAAPAAAPLAGTTFKTAKGSVYTYLPDGRTQRFKTATNEQNEPQDLTVFVKFKDAEQEQDFLEGIQRSERFGTKVYLIDQQGNKYDTNEQAAGKDVRLVLVKDGKVIDTVETSLTPQIGYNTFDQRRFKKDGENYREAHLGNKVTEINPASETTPNQSPTQQIADLRAKEQAEYDAMPDPNDEAKRKEIYDRYDKQISPLLGEKAPKAGSLRDVELTMRRPEKNEVIFVPIDALLEKQAADQPSYDIQKEGNRIKGRVEKAKEFLKNYLKDQRAINPKTGKRTNAKVSFEPSVVDIDADGKISFEDGRHRVLAAKELGLTEVPIEVPKGKGKAIQESLKQKTTETKGKGSPKTIDRKATQALLDQANDELALTDEQYNELFAPESESPFTAFQTKGEAGRKAREALKEEVGPEEFRRMDNIHRNGEKMLKALEGKGLIKIDCP